MAVAPIVSNKVAAQRPTLLKRMVPTTAAVPVKRSEASTRDDSSWRVKGRRNSRVTKVVAASWQMTRKSAGL